jgi:hypothetical protein
MFKIGKESHLLHAVGDPDAADGWHDDVFAVRRFVRNSPAARHQSAANKRTARFSAFRHPPA